MRARFGVATRELIGWDNNNGPHMSYHTKMRAVVEAIATVGYKAYYRDRPASDMHMSKHPERKSPASRQGPGSANSSACAGNAPG